MKTTENPAKKALRYLPAILLLVAFGMLVSLLLKSADPPDERSMYPVSSGDDTFLAMGGIPFRQYVRESDTAEHPVVGRFFERLDGEKARCDVCPLRCVLGEGQSGACRTRENRSGEIVNTMYGKIAIDIIDPTTVLSGMMTLTDFEHRMMRVSTAGCMFRCPYCIAGEAVVEDPRQARLEYVTPSELVKVAKEQKTNFISFAALEPAANFEYVFDAAKLAHESGLGTILGTNGFVSAEPFDELVRHFDAVIFGLKGFSEATYSKYTGGSLAPILRNMVSTHALGVELEIMYVLVPTVTDDMEEIRAMAIWIRDNLGADTPVHLIRYRPAFRMKNLPMTSLPVIRQALQVAREVGLTFVVPYLIEGHSPETLAIEDFNTVKCPNCGKPLVRIQSKDGVPVTERNVVEGRCKWCNHKLRGFGGVKKPQSSAP